MQEYLTPAGALPADGTAGTLVGRAWVPGAVPGPSVVALRDGGVFDLSRAAPTITDVLNADDPVALAGRPASASAISRRSSRTAPATGATRARRISWRPATCRRSRPRA